MRTVFVVACKKVRLILRLSLVAQQAGDYPGFSSMKRLGVFLLPPGWGRPLPLETSYFIGS